MMIFLNIKRRPHSYIFYLALSTFFLFAYACGRSADSSDSISNTSNTGSIALSLVWKYRSTHSSALMYRSPSGDVCQDYGIETINGQVFDTSGAIVATEAFKCSAHEGTFENIPVGTMSVEIVGVVNDNVSWSGEHSNIEVTANGTPVPIKIEMQYTGDDVDPPEVVATDPPEAATGVSVNKAIVARFNEDMVEASVNTDTFKLNDGTSDILGSVVWDSNERSAIFTPSSRLAPDTTYIATITRNVEDRHANTMAIDFSWSFTTSQIALGLELIDDPIFGQSSVIRDEVNDLDFLRLDFTTPYTYDGVVVETSSGNYFDGWRIASLADLELLGESADIVHGSIDAEMLARTELLRDWFCTDCVNLSTTHETARGLVSDTYTGNDNVVYQQAFTIGRRFNVTPNEVDFRISGYGGQQVQSEEVYLVRVKADATPPEVESTNPNNGDNNVAVNRNITATFSEAMDQSTITNSTFLVNDGANNIEGQVNYSGMTATFTPVTLEGNTLYTVTITSDVRDAAGNPLESDYIWNFTTSQNVLDLVLIDDPVFGTNSVIRDIGNGLDFLRLDFATPYTYEEIESELNQGGDFEGWRIASLVDLELLGESANITHGSTDAEMLERAEQLRDLLCLDCVSLSSTHEYVRGLVSDTYIGNDNTVFQQAFSIGRRFNVTPNEVDFRISGYGGQQARNEEVFLVRAVSNN